MSSEAKPTTPLSGTQFLEDLENKHTYVLDELDTLNARIESVLKMYVESRHVPGLGPVQPAATGSGSVDALDSASQIQTSGSKVA